MQNVTKTGKWTHLRQAFRRYQALDSGQKNMIRHGLAEGNHTPAEWLDFFEESALFDLHADASRKFLGIATLLTGIFTIFIFPFAIGFVGSTLGVGWIVLILGIVCLGLLCLTGLGLVLYLFLSRRDVVNYFREFVVPLLLVLREEMPAEEPLYLKLDLRRKDRKDNIVEENRNFKPSGIRQVMLSILLVLIAGLVIGIVTDHNGLVVYAFVGIWLSIFVWAISGFFLKYPRIVTTVHHFPWLEIKARLRDKSLVQIAIRDEINRLRITRKKRGSRGKTKIKTKTKYKIRTHFGIKLALSQKRYILASEATSPFIDRTLKNQTKNLTRSATSSTCASAKNPGISGRFRRLPSL
ncbi:MAG: hypothetical protein HC880_15740 [Bacteroidia bacterium]|nr:hypothetical protein [Bacteroidia bacterium]